jgi:proteasome lid subunit RPN8/RPN11
VNELTEFQRHWLCRRALQSAPYEACGFILDTEEIVEIRNVSLTPYSAFTMDRSQMTEKLYGREHNIRGIWHTHPGGTIVPSSTDLAGIKCGAILRTWEYYIVTATGVHLYAPERYAPQENPFWEAFVK